jgi:HK97 family phage major capsid protein
MAMEMKELERIIDERSAKQAEAVKADLQKELAGGISQAQIDEAVAKAVAEINAKAEKDKADNVKYLEAFKEAVTDNKENFVKETPVTIVNQMVASAAAAMGAKGAHNVVQVSNEEILAQAKKDFPYSKGLHKVLEQKKQLNAGTPSEGGFTVPLAFSGEYIDALTANTLIDKLGIRKVPLIHGNLSIPRMDSTSAVSWVGEISQGGKTQPTFGEVNMRAKKLKAITAISNTLLNESGVNLEGWISEDLMRKTRIALDSAMLNGTGTLYQPLGLANNSDVQVTGSSSTALALTTPNDMVALLQQANVKLENVHWLLNPIGESWLRNKAFTSGPFAWSDEMARTGKLRGFDFHSSSTVAYTPAASPAEAYADFWLGDFSEMMFGVARDITIEISKEGSFTDNGATISAFDQDLTLIRLITECDFACRQPKAFVHGTFAEK